LIVPSSRYRLVRIVLAAFTLSAAVETAAFAEPPPAPDDEVAGPAPSDFENLEEGAKFALYFRARAHLSPDLEPEQRLANGVRWRLLADERTGMRMPRITWMPNQQSMAKANAFFEMAHGRVIAKADEFGKMWRNYNRLYRLPDSPPLYSGQLKQDNVELTYATTRFVHYVAFSTAAMGEKKFASEEEVLIFDIAKGTVHEFSLCPVRNTIGYDLSRVELPPDPITPFAICGGAATRAFREIVKRWAERAIPREERTAQPMVGCHRTAHQLAQSGISSVQFLTPAGLALLMEDYWPLGRAGYCRYAWGDPVVIPYRALRDFMRPGPLSEELQKLP
jgi:hypothetical protein